MRDGYIMHTLEIYFRKYSMLLLKLKNNFKRLITINSRKSDKFIFFE